MKILVLATHFVKGGAEKQLEQVAEGLSREGFDVIHASIAAQDPTSGGQVRDNLKKISLGVESFRSGDTIVRPLKLLSREKPDVVISCIVHCDLVAYIWRMRSGCKWIMREPSTWNSDVVGRKWVRTRRFLGRKADIVVSNNRDGYDYWLEKRGNAPTVLIPNLLDFETLSKYAREIAPPTQSRLPYIVCVGRLEKHKNFVQIIEAFSGSTVKETHDLVIIGDGPDRQLLTDIAKEKGVGDKVVFLGQLSNPYPYIANAEVLASASIYEGCPNVAIEGAVLGAKLVLSDIPAHRWEFAEFGPGFFGLGDIDSCRGALETAIESKIDPELALAARKKWDFEVNCRRYISLLKEQ